MGFRGLVAMLVSEFGYELPEELIAQRPPEVRGTSRMMTLDRRTGEFTDRRFAELPSLLRAGDLLVLNDSRVIPARLYARRGGVATQEKSPAPTGLVEVLLTEKLAGEGEWNALVKPAKKVPVGETLVFGAADSEVVLRAAVVGAGEFGERTLRFEAVEDFHAALGRIGHLPLPPYIRREKDVEDRAEDRERYQTVYSTPLGSAEERGSSAAPTAGLHFTPEILEELKAKGVEIARLTLHVGLGTFQPVRAERTEEIRLHAESYTISAETAEAVNRARREGRRIVAAGTTSTRTLEHVAREAEKSGGEILPHRGVRVCFCRRGRSSRWWVGC